VQCLHYGLLKTTGINIQRKPVLAYGPVDEFKIWPYLGKRDPLGGILLSSTTTFGISFTPI
jgi:hypothetical protein